MTCGALKWILPALLSFDCFLFVFVFYPILVPSDHYPSLFWDWLVPTCEWECVAGICPLLFIYVAGQDAFQFPGISNVCILPIIAHCHILTIHPQIDTLIDSVYCALWILLQCTHQFKHLFNLLIKFLLGICFQWSCGIISDSLLLTDLWCWR